MVDDHDPDLLKDHELFGRIWTRDEIHAKRRVRVIPDEEPIGYPDGAVMDRKAKWVFWLPDNWTQAISTTANGKQVKSFHNEHGRRFWHKPVIEKYLGYTLPSVDPEDSKDNKHIKDPTLVPSWPSEDWLPHDWRIVLRQLPSTKHPCYVPPDQNEGFFYHRKDVEKYLIDGFPLPSPFGSSKTMTSISDGAKKRKTHHGRPVATVSQEDYEAAAWLGVARIPSLSADVDKFIKKSSFPSGKAVAEQCQKIGKALLGRGFSDDSDLIVLFLRKGAPSHKLAQWISGCYVRKPAKFGKRPCYQFVTLSDTAASGIICRPLYIFWNDPSKRWKVAEHLSEERGGYATCAADADLPPTDSKKFPWQVIKPEKLGLG
eukprot:TRINITY_DN17031_c0_g1_i2.p1 TRINITY_DN17031_c0_g1~~TRINITY_DN17031_c0_g1_i2.p1  ORF type:complete len:373 (+),score=72.89 TRINITY_DN17031_c0_g1_i2:70-1188(+)